MIQWPPDADTDVYLVIAKTRNPLSTDAIKRQRQAIKAANSSWVPEEFRVELPKGAKRVKSRIKAWMQVHRPVDIYQSHSLLNQSEENDG